MILPSRVLLSGVLLVATSCWCAPSWAGETVAEASPCPLPARPFWVTALDPWPPNPSTLPGSSSPTDGGALDRFFPVFVPPPGGANLVSNVTRWGVIRVTSGFGDTVYWLAFEQEHWSEPRGNGLVAGPLEHGVSSVLSAEMPSEEAAERLPLRCTDVHVLDRDLLDRLLSVLEKAWIPAITEPDVICCCDQPTWALSIHDASGVLHVERTLPRDRWDTVYGLLDMLLGAPPDGSRGTRPPLREKTGRPKAPGWQCGVPPWLEPGPYPFNINRRAPSGALEAIAPVGIDFDLDSDAPILWQLQVQWLEPRGEDILFAILEGTDGGGGRLMALKVNGEAFADASVSLGGAEFWRLPEVLPADTLSSECLDEETVRRILQPLASQGMNLEVRLPATAVWMPDLDDRPDWGRVSLRLKGGREGDVEYEGDLLSAPLHTTLLRLREYLESQRRTDGGPIPGDGRP